VGKQFQKLRTNQVRGQKIHCYGGLPGGQTVPQAQNQSCEGLISTLLGGLPGGQTVPEVRG
jgi:hypothetical protein